MKPLRAVFFGSGAFAVPALERLCDPAAPSSTVDLLAVVTRPDRPAGRGRRARPTPVRARAEAAGITPVVPESANDDGFLDRIERERPDIFVVADYGEFLGKRFRELPRLGAYNLHASLLPRHRGAAPVAHAILAGDRETGVTLFRIIREMDAGPIVDSLAVEIGPLETAGELERRLAAAAADLLARNVPRFADGTITETPQEGRNATAAPKLSKTQGAVDWTLDATRVAAHIRAMNPWPVAFGFLERRGRTGRERLRLLRAEPEPEVGPAGAPPGVVLCAGAGVVAVACGSGAVRLLELQRQGKAALAVEAFLRGFTIGAGDRFRRGP